MGRRVVHWREYEVVGGMMGVGYRGVGSNRGGEGGWDKGCWALSSE